MQNSDLKEIRKQLKSKEPPVDWVYGLYVSSENEPVWENIQPFNTMEEAEMFRHINLFSRILSGKIGKNIFPVPLKSQQGSLMTLRAVPGKEVSEFEGFRNFLIENHVHTDPYYAMAAHIVYDVPKKASDGRTLEDGDVVYESILFAICPASLSKPSLGFEDERVKELERRWNIGNPTCGFLYPSFDDRGEERNEALECALSPVSENLLNSLFEAQKAPIGQKDQKELFSDLMSRMEIGVEDAAAIGETISEKASDGEQEFDMNSLRRVAEECGVNTETFPDIYEETVGADTTLAAAAIAESFVTVKTESATIRVPSDKATLIKTRNIDGIDYLLVPADGVIMVNGAPVLGNAGTAAGDAAAAADAAISADTVSSADTDISADNAFSADTDIPADTTVPADTDSTEDTDAYAALPSDFAIPESPDDDLDFPPF
ncbi:MAG: DUF4317 family protein [Lachnospiraceae bacterium]|nr:DUF4317 family protein [Lachnospiraceae bacterium]